jgi:hypothetical protein
VHDIAGMGVVERLAEIGSELGHVAVGEFAGQAQIAQRGSLHELADEVGMAAVLAELIERDDAGMIEARRSLGLAQDPPSDVSRDLEHLDRDGTLKSLVPGPVHGAEAPRAEALLDPEAIENQCAHHSLFRFDGRWGAPAGAQALLQRKGAARVTLHTSRLTRDQRETRLWTSSTRTQHSPPRQAMRRNAAAGASHRARRGSRSCCAAGSPSA